MSLCLIAVVRLQTVSDITLHSYGPGAPQKVSQRLINANSSSGNCVVALNAVLLWRWRHRYSDLKSSFFAMIRRLGYFLRAETAQLISLNRHLPNLHCWSWEVSVLKFTLDSDFSHSKLWSWVSLSFLMISPCSFIVHCGWMFRGASQMPGILLIFQSGRERADPNLTSPDTNFRSNSDWFEAPLWFPI